MKGNFNSTILNYYQNVKPEAYANKKLNHSTKKELDYLYNRFIKAFDNEISLNELMVDLQSYDIDIPYEYMELKHYFVVTFKKYASKEYGIDDLEKYICTRKLFRESYEYFDNLRKDKITVREYRDYMEKLKIHPNTMKCFVLGYANTHGIKIDMTIETLPAMKVLDFIAKATQNEDINNLSDVTLNDIYQVLYDYAGFVNGDYNKSRGYLSRLRKKSNNLAKYFTQYGDEEVMAKLFDAIITKVMEITTNKYLIRKKEIAMQNKNNKVNEALEVVESYLNNDMCLTDFVTSKQMSVKEFDNCRKIVAKEKPEVYQKHIHPLDIDDDKTSKIMDVVNRLVYDLDEINILDFYEIAAPVNLSLDNFYEIVMIDDSWKRQTKIEVARFVNNNKVTHKDDEIIQKIMNLNLSMGDRKITQSDKEEIINYLKSINAPISHKIFMIALSRYVNGTLIEKGKVMEKIDL